MKYKYILTVPMICFLLGVGQVNAQPDTLRVWQNTNQNSLVGLINAMEANKWYNDRQGFTNDGLGWNSYQYAAENNLLILMDPECRTLECYSASFQERNNLTGEYTSVRDFLELARGPGIYLPASTEQQALLIVQMSDRVNLLQEEVQAGNEQAKAELQEFESRLDQFGLDLDQLSGLRSAVSELETTQAEHSERLTDLRETTAEQGQQLTTLSAEIAEQGSQIADLQTFDTELSERVEVQEENQNQLQETVNQIGNEQALAGQAPGHNLVQSLAGEATAEVYSEWFDRVAVVVVLLMIVWLSLLTFTRQKKRAGPAAVVTPIRSEEESESNEDKHAERVKQFRKTG